MKAVPAVLEFDPATSHLSIAGLTLVDRMVVAAHRAGCRPVFVLSDIEINVPRSRALGIPLTVARDNPIAPDALEIGAGAFCEARDLRRVVDQHARLASADGALLPIQTRNGKTEVVRAEGVAAIITDAAAARATEHRLWASLSSSADGIVDRYFNRPAGRLVSRALVHTNVSPNAVSVLSIFIGVLAAPFFATGHFIIGALLLQLSAIIDCVDGELARILFKESRTGKWLDLLGDQVVHFSVFAAIGIGVAHTHPAVPAVALGFSAALGVLFCLPPLIRALRQPVAQRPHLLNRLIDAAANRDFSVLLLFLALIGRLDLFLWMAGIGIHVFWIALVLLQAQARPAPVSQAAR